MRSTLIELGPWDPWVAVLLVLTGAALVTWIDLRSQRGEEGAPYPATRGVLFALLGGALGLALFLAVNRFGPMKVRSWGTALMLGFGVALAWANWVTRDDEHVSFETMIDMCIVILIGSVVGARLMSAALEWQVYAGHPERLLRVWEGGMSFHGGLIGGWVAGSLLVIRRKIPYGHMADIIAPAIAIGYAITRVGCFLNGCCYGQPTDLPWGVCFHELPNGDGAITRHPTQLYAAALMIGVFFLLGWIKPHLRREGHLGLVFLVLYSAYRFGIEYLRRGATAHGWEPLPAITQAQAGSIAIVAIAGGWLLIDWIITRGRKSHAEVESSE